MERESAGARDPVHEAGTDVRVGQVRYGSELKHHASRQAVKIFTERLVKTNTAGHGGGKRDKAENRTRAGLERVVNGKMSGQGLDGECVRAHT